MYSSLLAKKGLANYVAGADYNFRFQTAGQKIATDVEEALRIMNIQPEEIYTGQQVHGANVAYADGKNGDEFVFGKTFPDTDGLITDVPGVALLIKYADCTPIVLYDPVKKVQASVHSGWRSTVKRISLVAMEKMENDFKCDREDLLVYVGPTIDWNHYEVGTEVYEAFSGFSDRDQFFRPHGEKFQLSMLDANLAILAEAGIKTNQIEIERASTYTDSRLHSARGEGKEYQLNGLITMIES